MLESIQANNNINIVLEMIKCQEQKLKKSFFLLTYPEKLNFQGDFLPRFVHPLVHPVFQA